MPQLPVDTLVRARTSSWTRHGPPPGGRPDRSRRVPPGKTWQNLNVTRTHCDNFKLATAFMIAVTTWQCPTMARPCQWAPRASEPRSLPPPRPGAARAPGTTETLSLAAAAAAAGVLRLSCYQRQCRSGPGSGRAGPGGRRRTLMAAGDGRRRRRSIMAAGDTRIIRRCRGGRFRATRGGHGPGPGQPGLAAGRGAGSGPGGSADSSTGHIDENPEIGVRVHAWFCRG